MSAKQPRARRMSDADIRLIVKELDRWAMGDLGSGLSWAIIEEYSGFTRQALNSRPEIKAAFTAAKAALKEGQLAKLRVDAVQDNAALIAENARLKAEIAALAAREAGWKARWQRIAYHIRAKGWQVSHIDRPAPDGATLPSERVVNTVLKSFDKPIPPSGRV